MAVTKKDLNQEQIAHAKTKDTLQAYILKCESLSKEVDSLKVLTKDAEKVGTLEDKVSYLEGELGGVTDTLEATERSYRIKLSEAQGLEKELESTKKISKSRKEEISNLKAQLEELKTELEKVKKQSDYHKKESFDLREKTEELKAELKKVEKKASPKVEVVEVVRTVRTADLSTLSKEEIIKAYESVTDASKTL